MNETTKGSVAAIASGLLAFLCWSFFVSPWMLPLTFFPLWLFWISAKSIKQVIWSGWLYSFVATSLAFYWVVETVRTFFAASPLVCFVAWLIFASLAFSYYALVGGAWYWLKERLKMGPLTALMLLPPLFTLVDTVIPRPFPANFGYPWMWLESSVKQLADLVGFTGLAIVTFTASALACAVFHSLSTGRRRSAVLFATIALVTFASLEVIGRGRKAHWTETDSSLNVHLVQVNHKPFEMIRDEMGSKAARKFIVEGYLSFTAKREKKPADLMIWPETALPFSLETSRWESDTIKEPVRSEQIPLLTGAYRYSADERKSNTAYLLDTAASIQGVYDKILLMPYGEYLPLEEEFPSIRKLAPKIPQYVKGQDASVFSVGAARLSPSICYEALYPSLYRRMVEKNANFLVNLTGDYWFGPYLEPEQHRYMSLARAIEFRRPLVRSAETGVSSIILANGEIVATSPLNQPWQETVTVPFKRDPPVTFFHLYGEQIPLVWLGTIASICVVHVLRRKDEAEAEGAAAVEKVAS